MAPHVCFVCSLADYYLLNQNWLLYFRTLLARALLEFHSTVTTRDSSLNPSIHNLPNKAGYNAATNVNLWPLTALLNCSLNNILLGFPLLPRRFTWHRRIDPTNQFKQTIGGISNGWINPIIFIKKKTGLINSMVTYAIDRHWMHFLSFIQSSVPTSDASNKITVYCIICICVKFN